jgi:hypothetical protein
MLTENGLQIDPDAVDQVLRRGDVITIAFSTFPERLLIDTRHNAEAGPLVAIVDPVSTVQERYLWLGRHRGMFGVPEAFSFFPWPHTVRTLVAEDVLAPLRRRLEAVSPEAAASLDARLTRLLAIEQQAMRDAVRGEGHWRTVWQR